MGEANAMEMGSRALLYLKPTGGEDRLSAAIGARGWDVHVVNTPHQARDLMGARRMRVGLVELDHHQQAGWRRQTEGLLDRDAEVNWVALLPRDSTGNPNVSQAVSDLFYDYHTLPADLDRLVVTLGHAYGMAKIADDRKAGPQSEEAGEELGIVAGSAVMRGLVQQIRRVAESEFNVLIRGESGTGKELAAQAVHLLSRSPEQPFVAVNCGALPKDLIQTELFGHERGSFTGADRMRVGRIEAAQGGTLFLDEIGDLPLELQVNLLRFLQEKTIQRVGGTHQIPVETRVIAATHINLEKAVAAGSFREDLYYRLNVLQLTVPPLRSREGDVELLANHFFQKFSRSIRPHLRGFTRQALDLMSDYGWPGNVRELVNRVQRAVVMCDGRLIRPRDLALDQGLPPNVVMTLGEARAQAEKRVIETTLRAVRNNVSRAARSLDISRVTLYRLMEQHGIDWQRGRDLPPGGGEGAAEPPGTDHAGVPHEAF